MMFRPTRAWLLILGLLLAAVIGSSVTLLAQSPGISDDTPSKEEIERQARERGLTGTIHVPDSVPLDPDPRVYKHGPFLLVPAGWQGEVEDVKSVASPVPPAPPASTVSETRESILWREPRFVPEGFTLVNATSPQINSMIELQYRNEAGFEFEVIIATPQVSPIVITTWGIGEGQVFDRTEIDDMAAVIRHGPEGHPIIGVSIHAYDEDNDEVFFVQGGPELGVDRAIEIVRGLRK